MIGWEQMEQIKYDFSVQFMPFFNWLKKLLSKSDQDGIEQKWTGLGYFIDAILIFGNHLCKA